MARILATVFITRRGSFGVCECGFNTQVYAYYENAYDELVAHILQVHKTHDFFVVLENEL